MSETITLNDDEMKAIWEAAVAHPEGATPEMARRALEAYIFLKARRGREYAVVRRDVLEALTGLARNASEAVAALDRLDQAHVLGRPEAP